jgi:hypothetical protein
MSLFRTIAVVTIGVALLPSDPAQQEKFYERAVAAAHWTVTFCDRNQKTCEGAGEAWETLKAKAGFGIQVATDLAQKQYSEEEAPVEPAKTAKAPQRRVLETGSTKGTLKSSDLKPAWRGPTAEKRGQ